MLLEVVSSETVLSCRRADGGFTAHSCQVSHEDASRQVHHSP